MSEHHEENVKFWVDPPSGWKYGFPKIYDKSKDNPDMDAWIIEQGYPKTLREQFKTRFPYRFWEVTEE